MRATRFGNDRPDRNRPNVPQFAAKSAVIYERIRTANISALILAPFITRARALAYSVGMRALSANDAITIAGSR